MNILIVDDELKTLQEIEEYVSKYRKNDRCVACNNALKALQHAADTFFAIALLDIEMPVMNGLELAENLIAINPNIEIAFITAYNHYAAEAFEVNADDYVLKPVREERLIKTLDKLAGKSMARRHTLENVKVLNIQTFGKLIVKAGEDELKWSRQKSAEIFAYLLMNNGKWIHKDKLCDILWPDHEPNKALANLQTALYRLRKTLSLFAKTQVAVEYSENCYKMVFEQGYYDVQEFEALYGKALNEGQVNTDLLEKAFDIYDGRYLEEEDWLWSITQREMLDLKYRIILQYLVETSIKTGRLERLPEYMKEWAERFNEDDFDQCFSLFCQMYGKEQAKVYFDNIKKFIIF